MIDINFWILLKGILQRLPFRKVLFTNADTRHAIRVLQSLGLEDCFERIISFDTLNSLDSTNPPLYNTIELVCCYECLIVLLGSRTN
ncbi:hypothetical protein P8452_16497 [Trifolium repens]|nr:hypothetical protein P8452_16497 [Trifolium repens]